MKKIIFYFSEVFSELKKVTWPKRQDVVKLLALVVVISTIVAFFVAGIDFGLTKALEKALIY